MRLIDKIILFLFKKYFENKEDIKVIWKNVIISPEVKTFKVDEFIDIIKTHELDESRKKYDAQYW